MNLVMCVLASAGGFIAALDPAVVKSDVGAARADAVEPDPLRPEDVRRIPELAATRPPVVDVMPRFMPDGKHVLYVSDREGARTLYVKALDDFGSAGLGTRIAPVPPRFRRPAITRDGQWITFSADERGDEAWALYKLSIADGHIEPLSPETTTGKLHRDGPMWTGAGDRYFFTARAMQAHGLSLWVQAAAPGSPATLVFTDERVALATLRGDGAQMLVTDAGKGAELSVVTLAGTGADVKKPRHLWPDAGRAVTIYGVAYAPDNAHAIVATDDGEDQARVLWLDLKTGRVLKRYVETGFAANKIQELTVRGDRIGFIVDAGTEHAVRFLDLATFKPVAVAAEDALPTGSEVPGVVHPNSTGGFTLSGDGRRALVQWSTPMTPARVWIIDTHTGKRAPMFPADVDDVAGVDTTITNIPSWDGVALPTIVYLPTTVREKPQRLPVVVQMHGGFPYASTARFDPKIRRLVGLGYAVVEPNVRGSGGFGRAYEISDDGVKKLDAVRDLGAIGRWVQQQPWADANRLAVTGASVGGYYTLLALEHDPELWRCGISLMPIVDVIEMIRTTDGDLRNFLETKELAPLSEELVLRALSPSSYGDRIRAPLLIVGGTRDARTPVAQIEGFVKALRARGAAVEYMRADLGHSIDDPDVRAELLARTLRFLEACR